MELVNPDNLEAFLKVVLDAVQARNWALLAALLVIAAVWGVRKIGKPEFVKTDAGGSLLVLLMSGAGAVASALLAGQVATWALVFSALQVGFMAAGGYSMLKKLLWPLIVKLLKLPAKKELELVHGEAKAEGEKSLKLVEKAKFEDLGK